MYNQYRYSVQYLKRPVTFTAIVTSCVLLVFRVARVEFSEGVLCERIYKKKKKNQQLFIANKIIHVVAALVFRAGSDE